MGRHRKQAYDSLGAYLEAWCKLGKTQADFAAQFGISVGYLSDLKNGKVRPSWKLARRLSAECSIPMDSLFLDTVISQ